MKKIFPKVIVPALLTITTVLWVLSKPDPSTIQSNVLLSLAQIAGLYGAILLSWSFILSSRFLFIDSMYGGLDKVYRSHRKNSMMAYVLMLAHPFLMILMALPKWSAVQTYILPSNYWPMNWGILALWSFTLLIVLTLFAKLPYHIWKKTHQLMGLAFAFVALHIATIPSDVSQYLPLRYWILGAVSIGLIAYVYKVFLYKYLGPKYDYVVKEITQKGAITELQLSPKEKPLYFMPGQFVFISTSNKQVGKEEHPFSISSSPDQDILRISIKNTGDYTSKLKMLRNGDAIRVQGPYGQFGDRFFATKKPAILIGAGIGITPFLSLINYSQQHIQERSATLFYCTKNKDEAVYNKELKKLSSRLPNFKYKAYFSKKQGRINAHKISQQVDNISEKLIFLCGPETMIQDLQKQFILLGVPQKNIIFEDFSFK